MPTALLATDPTFELLKRLMSAWAQLKTASLPDELGETRQAVLNAILPYAFPQLDGAELADDAWQSALSWFSKDEIVTANALDKFQTNFHHEINHAVRSWFSYQTSKLNQATQALEALNGWVLTQDVERRSAWMVEGVGFGWWVLSSVLQPSHKAVCLAFFASGWLEWQEVQNEWEKIKHPISSRDRARQLRAGKHVDWSPAPWPEEWSVAWERGRLRRHCNCDAIESERSEAAFAAL